MEEGAAEGTHFKLQAAGTENDMHLLKAQSPSRVTHLHNSATPATPFQRVPPAGGQASKHGNLWGQFSLKPEQVSYQRLCRK